MPSLQTAMSGAQTLVAQFQSLQNQVNQSAANINSQVTYEVNTINNIAQQLATLNQAVQIGYSSANNQPPNTLLDQRDALVSALSKETQVTVVPQGNQYNVFIGNGQPLVLGTTVNTLTTVQSSANPNYLEIAYSVNGQARAISENNLPGGALGGLFAFRSNSLSSVQNTIGQIAIVLGSSINAQNQLGQTINGTMGTALFNIASPVVYADANNQGNAQLSATMTNAGALKPDNYTLSYDGSNYTITDTTTNTVKSTFAAFPGTPTQGVNIIDGVTYTLSSGAMTAGDSFAISPTAAGASSLSLTTTDPTQIAGAAPIVTRAATTNTGSGVMTPGSVTTGFVPTNASPATTLTYNSATTSLSGFPVGSNVVVTSHGVTTTYANYVAGTAIPYTSGMSISFNNMQVSLSGSIANGDTFTIGPNANGTGDNRNVLLMNALATQNTMNNGAATYQGAYAQMVNSVGNMTAQVNTIGATEKNLLSATIKQQQALSGVNLDEQTINLLQYQQVYGACSKLIQIANQNFSTLLGVTGAA
jgi:flagellar hook-associated protein 1 FlgK